MVPGRRHLGVVLSASGIVWCSREWGKGQPAALPRLESDDAYGSASTYICVGPRFREQIPCTLASLMASTLEPPAAGPDPHHEASPPARSRPADRAEFKVLPERAAVSAPQAAPHHPRAARAARAASSTPKGRVRSPSSPSAVAPGWACSIKALNAVKMSLPLFTGEPTFRR